MQYAPFGNFDILLMLPITPINLFIVLHIKQHLLQELYNFNDTFLFFNITMLKPFIFSKGEKKYDKSIIHKELLRKIKILLSTC